jgi:5-(carboxyamino)imidazole ribonucleotide synthase
MARSITLSSSTTIGFLGAGQLARMSALQAFRFGFRVAGYADRPAEEPLQWMTPLNWSGGFDDIERMTTFARACDVVTLENEFIDSDVLREVME